jgi:hypothetical protein
MAQLTLVIFVVKLLLLLLLNQLYNPEWVLASSTIFFQASLSSTLVIKLYIFHDTLFSKALQDNSLCTTEDICHTVALSTVQDTTLA